MCVGDVSQIVALMHSGDFSVAEEAAWCMSFITAKTQFNSPQCKELCQVIFYVSLSQYSLFSFAGDYWESCFACVVNLFCTTNSYSSKFDSIVR